MWEKNHYETIFYEREKHYKTLLYKEGMKIAMVYRYSDMNVYQVKMINCEIVRITCMSTFTVLFKSWQIIDPLLICYFPYNIIMYPVHQLLMFYLIPIMETNKLNYWFHKKYRKKKAFSLIHISIIFLINIAV